MSELFDRVLQHANAQGDHVALWQYRRGEFIPTTYAELARSARHFAKAFVAGVPSGTTIPLCSAKTPDCIAAMLGALAAGCAFSSINQKLRAPQIEKILSATRAPVAIVDGPGLVALKGGLAAGSPIARTQWWLVKGKHFGRAHERLAERLSAVARVEEWTADERTDPGSFRSRDTAGGVGCCLFTSGSTGNPKGVLIDHEDLSARAESETAWFGLEPKDVLLSLLPFSFDVGLNQLMSALWVGCELVLLDSWFPKDIMNAVEARKVTGISGVPSIWLDFLTKGQKFQTRSAHRSLRFLTVSGGDLSRRDLDRLPDMADGVGIFKTYGQTEAFRGASLKPDEFEEKRYSVGRAFRGAQVYVVRNDGSLADPGEKGEVVHTGLGVMRGYLDGRDPENKLRANPFVSADDTSTRAVFTGDEGVLDEAGYLFLHGRRDDMAKIQGNRVYPAEVREQLLALDGVEQAEVIPIKTKDENRLVAFVVITASHALKEEDIPVQMANRAPTYMLPALVVSTASFPLTANGKLDRQQLTADATRLLEERTSADQRRTGSDT